MNHFSSPKKITDEKLYLLCKKYGTQAKFWRQKFIGLLPEVHLRRLYERKGFTSIFEFAAKIAGLSHEQVRLALNLEQRFHDKPSLQNLLISGEASLNKLTRVVSIATIENENELAEKVRLLPQKALEVLVRDERKFQEFQDGGDTPRCAGENGNGSQQTSFEAKSLRAQTSLHFKFSPEVAEQLNELHAKGIDVNELLREMLEKREQEIATEKEEIAEVSSPRLAESRYIPARTRRVLTQEFGEKCSIQTCLKPSREIHHAQRFSLSRSHDPRFLAPLCHEHHVIAHAADVKFQEVRGWALRR